MSVEFGPLLPNGLLIQLTPEVANFPNAEAMMRAALSVDYSLVPEESVREAAIKVAFALVPQDAVSAASAPQEAAPAAPSATAVQDAAPAAPVAPETPSGSAPSDSKAGLVALAALAVPALLGFAVYQLIHHGMTLSMGSGSFFFATVMIGQIGLPGVLGAVVIATGLLGFLAPPASKRFIDGYLSMPEEDFKLGEPLKLDNLNRRMNRLSANTNRDDPACETSGGASWTDMGRIACDRPPAAL